MKNKNSFLLSLMLLCIFACSVYIFAGGIKGESAYELAVKNGFVGTETEWINSLKGQDGEDGEALDYFQMYQDWINEDEDKKAERQETSFLQFIQSLIDTGNQDKQLFSIQNSIKCSVGIYNAANSSAGSGVIFKIEEDGTTYIVTNFHVTFEDNMKLSTYTKNQSTYYVTLFEDNYLFSNSSGSLINAAKNNGMPAEYVGGMNEYDLAVIKISDEQSREKMLEKQSDGVVTVAQLDMSLAMDKKDPVVGTSCYAVGNAMGEGISATEGIISISSEWVYLPDETGNSSILNIREYRVSCQINGGNSGGGLFSNDGKLIGIVNARREAQGSGNNQSDVNAVSYVIPLSVTYNVYRKILLECDNQVVTRPTIYTLGVDLKINSCTSKYEEDGTIQAIETVAVESVESNSLASDKLLEGDWLQSFTVDYASDDMTDITEPININHTYTLTDIELSLSVGDKIKINCLRAGENVTVEIEITAIDNTIDDETVDDPSSDPFGEPLL